MKTLVSAAMAAAALMLAVPARAQNPVAHTRDADPALWVVEDADTTIYLFGTIHVLKPGLSWFDEAIKDAFDKSDQLVVEVAAPDPAAMRPVIMAKGMTASGPTLTEQLPQDKRAAFAKSLADLGVPEHAFDRMRPWMAATTLGLMPLARLGYDQNNGPDVVLAKAAKAGNKPVVGLETAEQQINIFAGVPDPAQMAFLVAVIDEMPKIDATMATMVASWGQGDPDAIAAQLNRGMQSSPEVAKALIADRNRTWAVWISERLKNPGVVFVAVGAGHLAGADSVQQQLAALKLSARRIDY